MKKVLVCWAIILCSALLAQGKKTFSNFDLGIYGGTNFKNIDNIGGNFLIELKTNLSPNINLKASVGYNKTIQPYSSIVNKYSENNFGDTLHIFFATKYSLLRKNYDMFALTFGVQYSIKHILISPYLSIDAVYNFIDTHIDTSPPEVWSYNSIDEVPAEFKGNPKNEKLVSNSYGLILGIGVSYPISSKLNIDIRYMFKFDNSIINTHHFIAGICF